MLLQDILKKKNEEKYLILHSTDKYEKVWSRIRSKLDGEKELFYEKKLLQS